MPIDVNGFIINSTVASNFQLKDITTVGLKVHLDAGAPESYPGSGTTWFDLSGNGYNGTLTNGPTYSTANGGEIVFAGASNHFVQLGNIGSVGTAQTIEVWFNSTNVVNYKNVCDMNYSTYFPNQGNAGPRLEMNSAGESGWNFSGNTTNNAIFTGMSPVYYIANNIWYHSVWSINSSGLVNTWLNGVQYAVNNTSPFGYQTSYADVSLGRGFILDTSRYFSGRIPIFRVYSRALSMAEVVQNYNVQKQRFGL
jgi:hypothetical protein